ncbi:MAG: hypothetical protein QXE78_09555 [Nitrososphaeria archaeon]
MDQIFKLGEKLQGGEFIESPFDSPIEDERQGDPDQRDDDLNFSKDDNICISLEKDLKDAKKDIKNIRYTPRLTYFLDGSLRTKYLGEYVEGSRSFPILASELSCAVVMKSGKSLLPHCVEKRLAFIFPHKDTGLISDTLYEKLFSLDQEWRKNNPLLRIEFLKKGSQEIRDIRYSMQGKARDLMHSLEHEVAENLARKNDWLVMDGAIRKEEFLKLENTIGLAKSFSRKPTFDLGDGKPLMITTYLSKIREGERSAVFKKSDEKVAFWYLRIRTYPPMEPLGGLVKIDFKMEETQLSSDLINLIDQISAEIYSFRSPSVYPHPRWPSFIYPIRLAEEIMASTYLNKEIIGYFSNILKKVIKGVS